MQSFLYTSSTLHKEDGMSASDETAPRTRWGRTKFAAGRWPAMIVAIPVGLVLAAALGGLTLLTGIAEGPQPFLVASVTALVLAWGLIGLVWAVIVDRSTLRGALDRPEESVESRWLESSMSGAFSDTILLAGLATAAIALTGVKLDAVWVLVAVICFAFFSTAVRYLMAKQRG